jgi:hypothetical protein
MALWSLSVETVNLPLLEPVLSSSAAQPPRDQGQGLPLLRLGFRPFYIGAAAYAAIAVPLWVAAALGLIVLPTTISALLWHAHEMLFGFASAVIVGFLLTAGKAWTGQPTPRGAALGALALLWLAAPRGVGWPHGWRRWARPMGFMRHWIWRCCLSSPGCCFGCCCAPAIDATCPWSGCCSC